VSVFRRRDFALLGFVFCVLPLGASGQIVTTRTLAKGVTLVQEIHTAPNSQIINILRVDLKAPGVRVRCGQAWDTISLSGAARGRESVQSLAERNKAIAGINADYFPFTGDPLGIAIQDGALLSEPMENRAALGIGKSGVLFDVLVPLGVLALPDSPPLNLTGINRVPHNNDVIALTPAYAATPNVDKPFTVLTVRSVPLPVRLAQELTGVIQSVASFPAGSALPLCPSDCVLIVGMGANAATLAAQARTDQTVRFRYDVASNGASPVRGKFPSRAAVRSTSLFPVWGDVEQAVSGGPFLVRNGQIAVDGEAQGFPEASFVAKRHPRTAAGVTADGTLLLVTVDGRQERSLGMSLPELAALMRRLGAINALNLDGGGSTTMAISGGVVNAPSDGRTRPVANGLLVYAEPGEATEHTDARIAAASEPIENLPDGELTARSGETLTLRLVKSDGSLYDNARIVWGTDNGMGFVAQSGRYTAFAGGTGSLYATVDGQRFVRKIRVLAGTPAVVKATLKPADNNPPDRNLVQISVTDKWGNGVIGVRVNAVFKGGELLSPLITDAAGKASSEIVWDLDAPQRQCTLTCGSAAPLILKK
jgi:hypothetical protein